MRMDHMQRLLARLKAAASLTVVLLASVAVSAQQVAPGEPNSKLPPGYGDQYAGRKKVLIIGDTHTGNQSAHDAVSHAMATLERLGRESAAYIAFIRTDMQWITKAEVWGTGDYAKGGPKQARGHNLSNFDALIFYTNGDTDMTERSAA